MGFSIYKPAAPKEAGGSLSKMAEPSDMSGQVCGVCGNEIPLWAPSGNCPACLFRGRESGERQGRDGSVAEVPRERIGAWELQEKIGAGAFGVVFAAEQTRPVQRAAAIKILRPGMASKEVLARFEAESQALAILNHPDIVTIYDAGTTEDGRPYFAMEFVPGVPVTEFASGLSVSARLGLFDRICAVVEHAHRRGIIHRDLKPANILVYRDERGRPVLKLLDFGIAKATDHVLTEATILTGEGHFLGTPEYMSPEQTADCDVDTRADIYSLGVILYELLTGAPPFRLKSQTLDAVLGFIERVREETAPMPSQRAPEGEVISTDLDWITSKAIEKDRDRRYQSVGEFREDLRRFQENEPVRARPPDTIYLARKFLRRHWKLASALGTIALSIIAAALISTAMALKARDAARETQRAYSRTDLQSGIAEIDRSNIAAGIGYLVRSLRTDPENREAAMMLRSTLDQFPLSRLVLDKDLSDRVIRNAFFTTPEGDFITINEIGTIRFFNSGGDEVGDPISFEGTNQRAAISPDRGWVAFTNVQGMVGLIDLEQRTGRVLDRFSFGTQFQEVVPAPDGKSFCVASTDGYVRLWDAEEGSMRWSRQLDSQPLSIAYAHRGAIIAVATRNGRRIELRVKNGQPSEGIPQQTESIQKIVPSGSGHRFYTVSEGGEIAAVDQGRPPRTFTTSEVKVPVLLTAVDPAKRLVAYASEREVSVWTVDGITVIRRMPLPDRPSELHLATEENLLIIGMEKRGVLLWDFEHNRLAGTEIAVAKNSMALQYDSELGVMRCLARDGVLRHFSVPRLMSDEGKASAGLGLPVSWQGVPLEQRNDSLVRRGSFESLPPLEKMPDSAPRAIGCSPDGELLFGAFRDRMIRVWNTGDGTLVRQIPTETTSPRTVDMAASGDRLIHNSRFCFVGMSNLSEPDRSRSFRVHLRRDIANIDCAPEGDRFAIAFDDGSIRIWGTEEKPLPTESMAHDIRGNLLPHYCRFSNQGHLLVSWGGSDRAFRLWDIPDGRPRGDTIIPEEGVPAYAYFHPGDRFLTLVVRHADGSASRRVWSVTSHLPVSPRIAVDPETFDFSRIELAPEGRIPPEDLDRIESAIGDARRS